MGNAKVIIKQQDRSQIVPALAGIEIGTVINSAWGPIEPRLVTTPTELQEVYGQPVNKKGSSWNGAELLLANSSSVYITRAIHNDAKYSASLARFKITPVDFNSYPAPNAVPDLPMKPIAGGLSLTAFDSYTFPLYLTNRVYEDSTKTVLHAVTSSLTVEVTGFNTPSGHAITSGDEVSFGETPNDTSDFYTVVSAAVVSVMDNVLTTSAALTGVLGTEVKKMVAATPTSYNPPIYLIHDCNASNQLDVDSHDVIINGDSITLNNGTTVATVTSKDLNNRNANILTLNSPVTLTTGNELQWMVSNEFEYRDAFLVMAKYPGAYGDRIKTGIRKSTNYENAFLFDVYWDGVLEETFEVTRDPFIDGFGYQMQLETKVNGISRYVTVKDNSIDPTRKVALPTTDGVWRRNSEDIFNVTTLTTVEDIVKGDEYVTLQDATAVVNGTRLKFSSTGPEYKVLSKSSNTLHIDRPIVEFEIEVGAFLYVFNETLQDAPNGVINGTQYYKFSLIPNQTEYKINDQLVISDIAGKVLDAGTNNEAGGFDGSALTVFDIITAFNKMDNKEKYHISIFCDNGFAYPEVAIAINAICKHTNLSHGYLSATYASELNADPVAAILDYRNSTNLNSEYVSLFTGWLKVTDVYNQTRVWVAPSVFGVITQSFVTRNYYIFTPAAGWVYGRLDALDITVKFTEGQRDRLVDAQINPLRYREGYGIAVWGNETMYVRPSPLQLRSVAMLLIVLKYGLENYLEFKLFAMNREPTWTEVEDALSIFIRDTLLTPGGLYAFQVSVKKVITDTDIDNRRMPVFVGIQPTMDIKEIPVTLGIFNKSVQITV